MKSRIYTALAIAAVAFSGFTACDDTASEIGTSLGDDNVEIIIDSSFTAVGRTVIVDYIQPKTAHQLIGRIDIPEYGSLTSEFVAQFLPSTELDTAEFSSANVDSIYLNLRYIKTDITGDSLAPMGITVYPLTQVLGSGLTSQFNPEGSYNTTPLASRIYNSSWMTDSTATSYGSIDVKLPDELGKKLFEAFEKDPAVYANGKVFAEDVFPGIYVKNSYGSGRMTVLSTCAMTMYMRNIYMPEDTTVLDTIDAEHTYFLTTPEVVCNNTIKYEMSKQLRDLIDEGHTLFVAPAGTEIEFEFPLKDIISKIRSHSNSTTIVNGLSLNIPVDSIANENGVTPPPYALLILKKDRDAFFAKNKLPDNITSFYTSYTPEYAMYNFNGLRAYLMDMLEKEEITEEDYTFSLIPVEVVFEDIAGSSSSYYYSYYYYGSQTSTQTESEIQPYYANPVMADVRLDKARINLTYSLQTKK